MKLSPLHKRSKNTTKKKSVTWRDRQVAVTELLYETSALIDVFYEVSAFIGPQINLNSIPHPNSEANPILQSKLGPILSESCNDLMESLSNFEPKYHTNSKNILFSK